MNFSLFTLKHNIESNGIVTICFDFITFTHTIAMDRRNSQGWTRVLLKGQMRYINDIDGIVFLCSPL